LNPLIFGQNNSTVSKRGAKILLFFLPDTIRQSSFHQATVFIRTFEIMMLRFKTFLSLLFVFTFLIPELTAQAYDSRNGYYMPPKGQMRILCIMVNIIYDQTPLRDPLRDQQLPWKPGKAGALNSSIPEFLPRFLDPDLRSGKPQGVMTRLFYESSLGHFILLGDFVMVDVAQSQLTPARAGADFSSGKLLQTVVEIINRQGGLQTVFGHDSIADYDFFARGDPGLPKQKTANGKIDFVQFIFRNTVRGADHDGNFNYGQFNGGEGQSWVGNVCSNCGIRIGNKLYESEMVSIQNTGGGDYSAYYKNIAFHEFAHNLFGDNGFHTSGGNHYQTHNTCVFMGMQGGWGLMGGYNSSLLSCNAFERWRMGWTDTILNTSDYSISASGKDADMDKEKGAASLLLRDFVGTGDALRIRLPYCDSGAKPQYIWLENHQIGRNGKIDFMHYSNENPCREPGLPGIYAYVQVGKEKLSGNSISDVYPSNETDNLRVISAKGNRDTELITDTDTAWCIAWKRIVCSFKVAGVNPFCGYTDLQTHFFDPGSGENVIDNASQGSYPWIIQENGRVYDGLPFMGDNREAFTGKSEISMETNPAAVNVITSYCSQGGRNIRAVNNPVNNLNIHLSGLQIVMEELRDGSFRVDVRWDHYTVNRRLRWTGSILLHEKLILQSKADITLDENPTIIQIRRDPASGRFSPATVLRCLSGSRMVVEKNAVLRINDRCALRVDEGAVLVLEKGSKLKMNAKAVIVVQRGGSIQNLGAKISGRGKKNILYL
jgi:hypothetical protein